MPTTLKEETMKYSNTDSYLDTWGFANTVNWNRIFSSPFWDNLIRIKHFWKTVLWFYISDEKIGPAKLIELLKVTQWVRSRPDLKLKVVNL